MSTEPSPRAALDPPLIRRLAWMAGIWAASVGTLGAVAFLLRVWLNP